MASRRGFTTGGLALLGVALSLTAPSLAAAGGRAGRLRRGMLGSGSPAALRDEDNVLDELYYFFGRELAASGSGSYSSSSGDGGGGGGGGGGQSDPKPAPDIVIETDDDGETSGTDEDRDVDAEEGTATLTTEEVNAALESILNVLDGITNSLEPAEAEAAEGAGAPGPSPELASVLDCALSPEDRRDAIVEELTAASSAADLDDLTTPQGVAAEYIVDVDGSGLCPGDDGLVQRYALAVLYFSTNGDNWAECFDGDDQCEDGDSFLSEGSVCDWAGISCNGRDEVTRIELFDNGLSGTVPAELAVLPSLRNVQLQENSIGGTVPSALCDQVSPLGEITTLNTDCGGDDPTIQCDCCTRCFRVNRGTGMSEEVEVP